MDTIEAVKISLDNIEKCATNIAKEKPLTIFFENNIYAVIMCTPGNEINLAVGFCLTEGIIRNGKDINLIEFCEATSDKINIKLNPLRGKEVKNLLQQKRLTSNTSCGICGKEMINTVTDCSEKIGDNIKIDANVLINIEKSLIKKQNLFKATGCTHAAFLYNERGNFLVLGEDIGRHNALDKAIGRLVLTDSLNKAKIAIISGRGSFEMIQKAYKARIPIVASISAVTKLAIDLANKTGITLIGFLRNGSMEVYSHKSRIEQKTSLFVRG